METEQGFVELKAGDASSRSVTVTPETQPTGGTAQVERAARPGRLTTIGVAVSVVGKTLVCKLPRWVVAGDKVHWTSYNS